MAAQSINRVDVERKNHPRILLETASLKEALAVIRAMGYDPGRMRRGALKRGNGLILFDSCYYDFS